MSLNGKIFDRAEDLLMGHITASGPVSKLSCIDYLIEQCVGIDDYKAAERYASMVLLYLVEENKIETDGGVFQIVRQNHV